jgi:chromosome segregation ATPase
MDGDLAVEILKQIRDELRQTRTELSARIDQTNARLDQTREELSGRIDEVARRVVESEMRTATAITALAGTLNDVKQLLREGFDLRGRVEKCEQDIADLRRRVG